MLERCWHFLKAPHPASDSIKIQGTDSFIPDSHFSVTMLYVKKNIENKYNQRKDHLFFWYFGREMKIKSIKDACHKNRQGRKFLPKIRDINPLYGKKLFKMKGKLGWGFS